jgi:regulation of enolase protein 1 (concanavalin A-like superfamily)
VASVTYDPPTIFCEELGDDIIVTVEITDIYGNTSVCSPIVTVDGLPCGWMNTDGIGCIGNNEADYDVPTETFTLTSDGCTPSYPYISDNQSFIKYEMCGDGYIKAYVDQINGHAYAGVELRNSIAANAKKVAMGTNTVNRLIRIARVLENYPAWPQQVFSLDKFWVKIERSGNIFRAYASPDDVIYFPYLFQFIPMDECTQVGLFVYSSTPGDVVTADFTNVEVVLGTPFTAGTPSDIEQNIAQQQSLNIGLTPNPARDEVLLNLHSFLGEDLMISIFNIQGQLMEHIALDKVEEATEVFAVDHLPEGTYYVNIRNSEQQQTLKLIIQR